jgi:hypothetical protein
MTVRVAEIRKVRMPVNHFLVTVYVQVRLSAIPREIMLVPVM